MSLAKPWPCPVQGCTKSFKSKEVLSKHKKLEHKQYFLWEQEHKAKERENKGKIVSTKTACPYCDYVGASTSARTTHISRMHREEHKKKKAKNQISPAELKEYKAKRRQQEEEKDVQGIDLDPNFDGQFETFVAEVANRYKGML